MTDAPDRHALAADYVCGLLAGNALAEAERLIRSDAAFAAAVARWRDRFAPLDDSAPAITPSASLWQRIEAGIAAPAPRDETSPARTWWNSLPLWRGLSFATAAAALLLAIGLGFAVREAQRTPALVAVLVDGTRAGAVVHVFNDGRAVLLPLTDIAVPPDRALQVWTLPSRERGPVSVGLMEQARTLPLTLQGLPATRGDQLFEITLEPRGGSPIGRPTGPILFKGLAAPTL
jgi:anti-sigma-K factor RskA